MTHPLRVVSVVSCVGERGLGVNEGLEKAVTEKRAHLWFLKRFDDEWADADCVEFRFPAGRVNNGGIFPRKQCAKWCKLEGHIWSGFRQFYEALSSDDKARVQIALPFPTKKKHITELRGLVLGHSPPSVRFEDLGSLAPSFMKRIKPLLDAGYRVGADTVPTDRVSEPGLATRLDLPRGYERVTLGVRARILKKWLERFVDERTVIPQKSSDTFLWNQVSPLIVQRATAGVHYIGGDGSNDVAARRWFELAVPDGMKLSLLLTGDEDDVMPVADLERVRPLLSEIRIQNVKDPAMREWVRGQRSQA